jgi:predicted nucleotidyltransferase
MPDYPYQQHTAAFRALTDVFHAFELPYFLIGGQARDLLLSRMQIPTYAKTKDIDFAVMVRDMGQFEQLRDQLLASGFEPTKAAQYRLIWTESHTVIDLLPFGAVADAGIVHFPPPGFDLSVRGFQEMLPALEYAEIDVEQTIRIPVAPLHGIFLLKVIAWAERPEHRMKDLDDMERILYHYWDFCEREVFDTPQHEDLFDFTGADSDIQIWGARVLGRHLARLLAGSSTLHGHISQVLQKESDTSKQIGPFLQKFLRSMEEDERELAFGKRMLDHLIAGLHDPPRPT